MGIRSGRFNTPIDVNTPITIVEGKEGAYYRIFNSGSTTFNVDVGDGSSTSLRPSYSLDVAAGNEVKITSAAAVTVQGIYEYLSLQAEIRSGRFWLEGEDYPPTTKHKIIDIEKGSPAFYRIFNTGKWPIKILKGLDQVQLESLAPEQSYDFEVRSKKDIYVQSDDDDHPISGIYDFLGTSL